MFLLHRVQWLALGLALALAYSVGLYMTGWWRGHAAGLTVGEAKILQIERETARAAAAWAAEGAKLRAAVTEIEGKLQASAVAASTALAGVASATVQCISPSTRTVLVRHRPPDYAAELNRTATIRERVERPGAVPQTLEHAPAAAAAAAVAGEGAGISEQATAQYINAVETKYVGCRAQLGAARELVARLTTKRSPP